MCTGIQFEPNTTVQGFSIFNAILVSWTFIIIGLMIGIKKNAHTENYVNQQGPKNLDSFWLKSVFICLLIYFLFSHHYLQR